MKMICIEKRPVICVRKIYDTCPSTDSFEAYLSQVIYHSHNDEINWILREEFLPNKRSISCSFHMIASGAMPSFKFINKVYHTAYSLGFDIIQLEPHTSNLQRWCRLKGFQEINNELFTVRLLS